MKKVLRFFMVALAFCAATAAFAGKDLLIPFDQLPQTALDFVSQNFADKTVSYTRLYTDLVDRDYKVFFSNGDTIEFDIDGNWQSIDCSNSEVPESCVAQELVDAVKKIFPNTKLAGVDLEAKKNSTQVKLASGIELEFDAEYTLIDIDLNLLESSGQQDSASSVQKANAAPAAVPQE